MKIELINFFLLNRKLMFSLNRYAMSGEKYQITPVSLETTKHDNAQEVSQERVTALYDTYLF